jgi:hypothetical protein
MIGCICSDAKEVKQQAQDSCFEFVVVLTKQLEARIDTLLQATTSTPSTSTIPVYLIDQALTIARLARLISAQSQQIKSILFAPDSSDSVVGLVRQNMMSRSGKRIFITFVTIFILVIGIIIQDTEAT